MKSIPNPAHRARGFSLVEVLVALIVICVGLLGCAKLGALLISSTGTSRVQALVALEASSIANSIQADRDFWDGQSGDWTPSTTALSITATDTAGTLSYSSSGSSTLANALSSPTVCESGTVCSPVNMAGYDLTQWATSLKSSKILQSSTSTISCASLTSTVTCTISIQWTVTNVAATMQEAAAGGASQTETYQMVVQP